MKNIILMIIILLFSSFVAEAKNRKVASIECVFRDWPFQNLKIDKAQILELRKLEPKVVRSYYLAEVTSAAPRKALAKGLYEFILSTEPSSEIRAFIEVTGIGFGINDPKNAKSLKKDEVCKLSKFVNAELPAQ